MAELLREFTRFVDECRPKTALSGRRPKTKPDDLGCEYACAGCQRLYPPSPFIVIAQPESRYSFCRPTEGRRLSRLSWLVTYRDCLSAHRRHPSWYCSTPEDRRHRMHGRLWWSVALSGCPVWPRPFSVTSLHCFQAMITGCTNHSTNQSLKAEHCK